MTDNFEFDNSLPQGDSFSPHCADSRLAASEKCKINRKNTIKRERFELISAYIDGEVTAKERRQVEKLLARDPVSKNLYDRLLQLHSDIKKIPVPPASVSNNEISQKVLRHVDRQSKLTFVWGGTAFAALFVTLLSGVIPGSRSPISPLTKSPYSEPVQIALNEPIINIVNPNDLMLGINAPVIQIPKATVADPEN